MNCPNCGLANPGSARFCENCGTALTSIPVPPRAPYPDPPQYQSGAFPRTPNSTAKNIGMGCLIALAIFMLLGLSCTRACFRHGRSYTHHRY